MAQQKASRDRSRDYSGKSRHSALDMMEIVQQIEDRVALPGDSETMRSRKTLTIVVTTLGALGTIANAVTLAYFGLYVNALLYMIFALFLLTGSLALLIMPASFGIVTRLLLITTIFFSALFQIAFGGFSSGVYAMPWAMLGPLGAVLFIGSGFTWITLGVFGLALISVALMEPFAAANGPQISSSTLVSLNVFSLAILCVMIALASLYLLRQVERYRLRADNLLLNILPGAIAAQLKKSPETIADGYREVSVLFADIVDFTGMSSDADPVQVVSLLNDIFSQFDELADRHGLEKIKTIGDAYMAAAGLPEPREDHAQAIAAFAFDMLEAVEQHEGFHGERVRLRIGINTGPVVAGVIGRNKFIYDLWGDAVNVASRMESNGLANEIQITEAVKEKLGSEYAYVEREPLSIKGKGMMVTYLLEKQD